MSAAESSAPTLVSIPLGTLPPVREFTVHVWRYRDGQGAPCITSPPGPMCSFLYSDQVEANAAIKAANCVQNIVSKDGVQVCYGHVVEVQFMNLQSLYSFLRLLSMQVDDAVVKSIADRAMRRLGFRWVE